jgi:cytochrome c biogenesis DsbD-like protein
MKKTNLACLLLVLFAGSAMAAAQQPESSARVSFEPISTIHVSPGKATPVVFRFHVKPGFHINSNKPSAPELIPTVLKFSLPGDVVIGRMEYPPGQLTSFPFDPSQKLSVYSGDVVIRARVVAPPSAATGTYTIHADLRYQACDNNACYPPKTLPVTFNVSVGAGGKRTPKARPTATSPHIHSN